MTGIYDLDAFSRRQEPQFAVGGLRDGRIVVGRRKRVEPDAFRRIPHGRLNPALGVGDPRVQFAARDVHQTACRVQPERTIVVLCRPVNRVAGQTVPARERSDVAVFNPAQAALLSCGPQRPIAIELKSGDMAFTKPISGCVRRPDLTILEIQHAAVLPE